MADEKFKKWSERYKKGEIKTATMPPIAGGPGPGIARMIGGAIATVGRNRLMNTLNKSREKGAKSRSEPPKESGRSGTFTDKLGKTRSRERTPKEKEKFGPLVKREENLPAKQSRAVVKREDKLPAKRGSDSRALTVARENKGDLQKYNAGSRGLANKEARTFGDKGSGSRLGTNIKRGAAALGVGAAAYGLYKGADKTGATSATNASGARDDRASSVSSGKSDKAAAFKAKQQGMKTKGSPTNPASKSKAAAKASAKPAKAKSEKPLTNFERMKMRGYEKEGIGGRSATSAGAKARVKKERSYKFKDLFR